MALKVLVKGETGVAPSNFTFDIAAALIAGGLTAYDHQGPYWASFQWEVTKTDTLSAGGGFGMSMVWESPAGLASPPGPDRPLDSLTIGLEDFTAIQALGPIYITRSEPGALWTLSGVVAGGGAGDSLISWKFAAMVLQSPDVIAL